MYKQRRKLLSQNFIYNQSLIKLLISKSSINLTDTVLEIGPGKGFITLQLLKISKRVIAVELDQKLILHLQKFFPNNTKLELHSGDFLNFQLPKIPYKVFSNIPFSIEGKIVRKLLESENPPLDSYLIVRKDLAERLSGIVKNNMFSITYKPFFDFEIIYNLNFTDFIPPINIKTVMWRIYKKDSPLIPFHRVDEWKKFIKNGFGTGQDIEINLKKYLGTLKQNTVENQLELSLKVKPSHLSLENWLKIFLLK